MNLRWKVFEKALRERVKPYDARRRMSFWQRLQHWQSVDVQIGWFRILPTAILAGIALFNTRAMTNHPVGWMTGIGVWGWLVTVARAGTIWGAGRLDPEYRLAWVLPLTAQRIYRRLLRKVLGGGVFLFLDFLIVYGALACGADHRLVAWTGALACAGLQAGFSLALTLVIVAARVNAVWLIGPPVLFLYLGGFGSIFWENSLLFLTVLQTCNPLAWMNGLYWEGWIRGSAGAFWVLLPVLLTCGLVPLLLRVTERLHRQGTFNEIQAKGAGLFLSAKANPDKPATDLAAQRQQILAGDLDQPTPLAQQGFVERFVARFLNPREHTLVEMLLFRSRVWSAKFGDCAMYLALYLATDALLDSEAFKGFLKTFLSSDQRWYLLNGLWIASFVFVGMMLFKSFTLWLETFFFTLGFGGPEYGMVGGRRVLPYRSFRLMPGNHWEVAAAIAKATTVLALLLVPPVVIFSLSPLWQAFCERTPPALSFPLKCLLFAWGFPLMVSSVNWGVSYLTGFKHWRSYLKTTFACVLAFVLAGVLLVSPTLWTDVLWGTAFTLATLLWFFYCGARYRKGLPV